MFKIFYYMSNAKQSKATFLSQCRLGKLACPRVNDDQKIDVGAWKMSSCHPHDAQIFNEGSCKNTVYFPYFTKFQLLFE